MLKFHIESAFIKDSGVKTELEGSTETENKKTPKSWEILREQRLEMGSSNNLLLLMFRKL